MFSGLTIGVDVDGVLGDFVNPVLNTVNEIYGTYYKEADIIKFNMEEIIGKEEMQNAMKVLEEKSFVLSMSIYEGAIDNINVIRKMFWVNRIVFVTSPYYSYKSWVYERFEWLKNNFNASKDDVIFTSDKTLFNGDILIDDYHKNLQKWIDLKRTGIKLERPWNKDYKCNKTAKSWDEVKEYCDKITNYISYRT